MTVRIGFLLPSYSSRSTSQWPAVVRAVATAGAVVEVVHPVPGAAALDLAQLRVAHHLYVLRKLSGFALSLAGALHQLGASIVNAYPATITLRDKIVGSRVLQAAGVPVPATYVASHPEDLAPYLDEAPLVVKPYDGGGGHHVQVVRTAAELASVHCDGRTPVFAQRYHPSEGPDRKLYVIGDEVFGVKKVFPRRTDEEKEGEPFVPGPELGDIARRCGQAFGIDLYGVDVIESGGRPYVVDVTGVPGYKGVPDAVSLLARHVYATAERASRGEVALSEALP